MTTLPKRMVGFKGRFAPSDEAIRYFEKEEGERAFRKQQAATRKKPTMPTFNLPPFEDEE